eukprot:753319-Hanusia_phi.AAC.5
MQSEEAEEEDGVNNEEQDDGKEEDSENYGKMGPVIGAPGGTEKTMTKHAKHACADFLGNGKVSGSDLS